MEVKIEFSVAGSVRQVVKILDTSLTPEALVAGLNDGKYLTTVQEDGDVIINERAGRVIASVLSVDNECSYEEFDLV
jgi:hypothetical protein